MFIRVFVPPLNRFCRFAAPVGERFHRARGRSSFSAQSFHCFFPPYIRGYVHGSNIDSLPYYRLYILRVEYTRVVNISVRL